MQTGVVDGYLQRLILPRLIPVGSICRTGYFQGYLYVVELAEEVSRSIPLESEAVCDNCGNTGAFDFMGDYFCSDCLSSETPNCFYADPPTFIEFIESWIELLKMGIKTTL